MFCVKCGKEIHDDAVICPHCGCATPNFYSKQKANEASVFDAPSVGYAVLGFFIPIVGLILYLVWKQEFPMRAKSAGKGALISVIVEVSLVVLIYLLIFIVMLSTPEATLAPIFIL